MWICTYSATDLYSPTGRLLLLDLRTHQPPAGLPPRPTATHVSTHRRPRPYAGHVDGVMDGWSDGWMATHGCCFCNLPPPTDLATTTQLCLYSLPEPDIVINTLELEGGLVSWLWLLWVCVVCPAVRPRRGLPTEREGRASPGPWLAPPPPLSDGWMDGAIDRPRVECACVCQHTPAAAAAAS